MTALTRTETSETRQVAALPWRRGEAGVEVMMITSRETRRWVIPKGGLMVGKSDPQAAAQEAYEEAGIQGETLNAVVGHFRYDKRLKTGAVQACVVAVYPLEVLIQLGAWPEDQQRQRRWMSQAEAADSVHEADLAQLIRDFRPQ
jgi:8-oxo-dGTP pyrophosphatase MutT (NUDIX family)